MKKLIYTRVRGHTCTHIRRNNRFRGSSTLWIDSASLISIDKFQKINFFEQYVLMRAEASIPHRSAQFGRESPIGP